MLPRSDDSRRTALLAFAACGGDDTTPALRHGTSQSTGVSTKTPAARATTQAAEASTDVLSELQNLGNDIQQVTGKVTYTSTDTAADGTVTTSTFTYYSKEPNSRLDTVDTDGTTAIIKNTGTTYICTSSDQSCIAETGSGAAPGGLGVFGGFFSGAYIDALVSAAEAQGIDVSRSSENIAGTDATCFSGNDNGDVGKFCFSDMGSFCSPRTNLPRVVDRMWQRPSQ